MFLGIEIGGTKLQLGVGRAESSELIAIQRADVQPAEGAEGIRRQVERLGRPLVENYNIKTIGIGFGGPVDIAAGRTIKSHHVAGWDDFPLADWCRETFGLPAAVGNDADMAGLGEARCGAGRGESVVFYSNVGTGIGGALVIGGRVYVGGAGVASELGHLRPGPAADSPTKIVETDSSGLGIAAAARANSALAAELAKANNCTVEQLSAKMIAQAALAGNAAARAIFDHAVRTYGWAIAQAITLLSPRVVVVGGGVPLAGEEIFLSPLRQYVGQYVFPPLKNAYRIVPAALGEEVVVHGALALARTLHEQGTLAEAFVP